MKLQENKWNNCSECGCRKDLIQEESYGCDWCGIEMYETNADKIRDYLEITVYTHDGDRATRYEFCTWPCLLSKLKTVKTDYFVTTNYLHYDGAAQGQTAKDFLNLIDWNKVKGKSGKYLGKKQ